MPSYVRAGIRKCARIRALSAKLVRQFSEKFLLRKAIYLSGMMPFSREQQNW